MVAIFLALLLLFAPARAQDCSFFMQEGVRGFVTQIRDKMVIAIHGGLSSAQESFEFCQKVSSLVPEDFGVASLDFSPSPLGKQEVAEAVLMAKVLKKKGAKSIGLIGYSHGGYIALMAAPYIKPAFVIDIAGMTDLAEMYKHFLKHPDIFKNWISTVNATKTTCAKEGKEEEACMVELSPITYAGFMNFPILIVHGTLDATVPYSQSLKLMEKLSIFRNRKVWLFLFPADHSIELDKPPVSSIIKSFISWEEEGHGVYGSTANQKEHKALPGEGSSKGNCSSDNQSGTLGTIGKEQPALEVRGNNTKGNEGGAGQADHLGQDH